MTRRAYHRQTHNHFKDHPPREFPIAHYLFKFRKFNLRSRFYYLLLITYYFFKFRKFILRNLKIYLSNNIGITKKSINFAGNEQICNTEVCRH